MHKEDVFQQQNSKLDANESFTCDSDGFNSPAMDGAACREKAEEVFGFVPQSESALLGGLLSDSQKIANENAYC